MNPFLNRRDFLGACGAAGGLLVAGGLAARPLEAAEAAGWPKLPPVKIHVVYVGLGGAWPKPEFDAKAEVEKFRKHLEGVKQKLGDVEFVGGELIPNNEVAAAALLPKLAGAEALLLVHLAFGSGAPFLRLVDSGLPTVIFSQPFSGHDWMYVPQWQKAGKKVVLLATSDYADLERAAALLRVPARMRQTRILYVGGPHGTLAARSAQNVKTRVGAELVSVSVDEAVAAHAAVDIEAAEAEAEEYWLKPAKKIVEPSREEIVKSARMFLAMKDLMIRHRARAITIHCLGGIPITKIGYPCLGFSKLNDLGLVGACEADMDSTLTMLLFGYAFGKPGFITDPLFDLAKGAVIHAHCLASTKMDGPAGAGRRSRFAPTATTTAGPRWPWTSAWVKRSLAPSSATWRRYSSPLRRSSRSRVSTTEAAVRKSSPGSPIAQDVGELGERRARQGRHDDPITPRGLLRRPHGERRILGTTDGTEGDNGGIDR